jgi:hypothetical protein
MDFKNVAVWFPFGNEIMVVLLIICSVNNVNVGNGEVAYISAVPPVPELLFE